MGLHPSHLFRDLQGVCDIVIQALVTLPVPINLNPNSDSTHSWTVDADISIKC